MVCSSSGHSDLFLLFARHADSRPAIPLRRERSAPIRGARAVERQATINALSQSNGKLRLCPPFPLRAALPTCPRLPARARADRAQITRVRAQNVRFRQAERKLCDSKCTRLFENSAKWIKAAKYVQVTSIGSSPHTRRTLNGVSSDNLRSRFISAHAENTWRAAPICGTFAVHLRTRGEHVKSPVGTLAKGGSSPHTRRTRFARMPARVSKPVHLRTRGEHGNSRFAQLGQVGSSPHTRRTPFDIIGLLAMRLGKILPQLWVFARFN